jgi:LysM repeat protein
MSSKISYSLSIFLFFIANANSVFGQTDVHVFLKGETIYSVSRKYKTSPKLIAKVNELDSISQKIYPYQKLIIPKVYFELNRRKDRNIKQVKHIVCQNESLFSIAEKYNTTVYDILLRNKYIKRGEVLPIGSEVLVIASQNVKAQISEQIIFLNSDKIDLDTVNIKDSLEYSIVKKFNDLLTVKVKNYIEEIKNPKIITDTLQYPETDKSIITSLLYQFLMRSSDTINSSKDLIDSLQQEILYIPNRKKRKFESIDYKFINQVCSLIKLKSELNALDDNLLAIRSLIHFWSKNYLKAGILADEALYYNPENETARFVNASLMLEAGQYEESIKEHTRLFEKQSTRPFILYNLANSYYYSLKFGEAIQYFGYLNDSLIMPEINYKIGHSYLLLDNMEGACEYLHLAYLSRHKKAGTLLKKYCR